jgi:hypothetical protein
MYIDELTWQQYSTLANIAPLPLNEQIRKYNIYINEILEARFAYLHHQMANPQSLGGGVDVQQEEEEEGLPSGCIEFVNNTTNGTFSQIDITSSGPTSFSISWGDGETNTHDVDGSITIDHTYADENTEYTARLCFDDISLVTELDFTGDD